MSMCEYCGKDMLEVSGCVKVPIICHGKKYDPIKVGDDGDWSSDDEQCSDCGAEYGHYHHPGCDHERCPVCGGQLIICGCIDGEG